MKFRISIAIFIFLFGLVLIPKVFASCGSTIALDVGDNTSGAGIIFAGTGDDNQQAVSEEFQVSSTLSKCGVRLVLKKEGSPVNNVVVELRTTRDGTAIASTSINGVGLTTSLADYGLFFSTPITLTADTPYFIYVGVDANRSESNRYHAGWASTYADSYGYYLQSGGWVGDPPNDLQFALYQAETPSSTPSSTPVITTGNYDYTSVCDTTTDASGTISEKCYNPVMVQVFYILDFLFFGVALGVSIYVLNKVFKI